VHSSSGICNNSATIVFVGPLSMHEVSHAIYQRNTINGKILRFSFLLGEEQKVGGQFDPDRRPRNPCAVGPGRLSQTEHGFNQLKLHNIHWWCLVLQ
jgi:hypothetical protein